MRMNIKTAIVWGAIFIPSLAFAKDLSVMDFKGLVYFIISDFIEPSITVIFSLAIVYFLWNIAEVIRKSGDPKELATLKDKAFWGVVTIFVMGSLWGLVKILETTFLDGGTELNYTSTQPSLEVDTGLNVDKSLFPSVD